MPSSSVTSVLAGLSAGVILVDEGRKIVFANPAAQERFGVELAGQDLVRAVRHPDCLQALEAVLERGGSAEATIVLQTPQRVTLQVSVAGVEPDETSGARAAICFEDISHVVAAEHMRSDFVANVSHELRSPLTSLSGFVETLKGAAKDDEAARARFLDLMEGEAQRMNRLIGDLLSLSRVEANERVRPMDRIDVVAVLRRVIKVLEGQADTAEGSIRLDVHGELRPVPGDEDQLMQVFRNLIENGLKYGAAGGVVTVSAALLQGAAGHDGAVLSVSVRDEGEGIAAHHIPRLTERFYRVDPGRSRDKGGTGLGLAIVKHIVHRHRGRLQIRSEPGSGSTFIVQLPVADGASPR